MDLVVDSGGQQQQFPLDECRSRRVEPGGASQSRPTGVTSVGFAGAGRAYAPHAHVDVPTTDTAIVFTRAKRLYDGAVTVRHLGAEECSWRPEVRRIGVGWLHERASPHVTNGSDAMRGPSCSQLSSHLPSPEHFNRLMSSP